jgi:hypothetical protein
MRIDGDIKKVTIDAVRAVSAALEMFLAQAVEGTGEVTLASGHRQMHDGHFRQFCVSHDEFDFLPDCLPPPGRMPKAVASKARSSTISHALRPAAAAATSGGGGRGAAGARGKGSDEAAAPASGGKQTVLSFGRQQQQQQQQDSRFDISSEDEGGGHAAALDGS